MVTTDMYLNGQWSLGNEINHKLSIDHYTHTHTHHNSIFNQSIMYDHHQSSSLMLTENHHIGWKMDRLPLKKRIIRYANFACSSSSSSSSLFNYQIDYHTGYRPSPSPTTSETGSLDSGFSEQSMNIEPLDLSYHNHQQSPIASPISTGKFYAFFSLIKFLLKFFSYFPKRF